LAAPLRGTSIDKTADQTNPGTRKPTVKKTASKVVKFMGILLAPILRRGTLFDDLDFLRRQAVEFVDEVVDLPIRRGNLRFEGFLLVRRFGGGEVLGETYSLKDVADPIDAGAGDASVLAQLTRSPQRPRSDRPHGGSSNG
jgi:hypothetical protein